MYPDIFEYATFSFQFQKFSRPHVFKIEFARPHLSDGIRIHSRETMPARCATILVYYSVRDWKVFLCYRIRNNRNNRPRVIGFVSDLIFSSLSLPNSLDACGWKPCAERKKCGLKNIRIRVDGTSLICFLSSSLRTFPATFVLCLHTQRPVPSSRPRKGTDHS